MSITASYMTELRERIATLPPDPDTSRLNALQTVEEIIGFVANCARGEGGDEADDVEVFVRLVDLPPDEVRRIERVLRPLGYTLVADRLRALAGRRTRSLAPLPR
jgi:hypothetical protein